MISQGEQDSLSQCCTSIDIVIFNGKAAPIAGRRDEQEHAKCRE